MAVFASITIVEPASQECVDMVNYTEDCPIGTLYNVAGILDHYEFPEIQLPAEVTQATINALRSVILRLENQVHLEGREQLTSAPPPH